MRIRERERFGVLVVRAWVERGAGDELRARLTHRTKDGSGSSSIVLAGADAVAGAIEHWLEDVQRGFE